MFFLCSIYLISQIECENPNARPLAVNAAVNAAVNSFA
jgi:hypothetical protein